MTVKAGQKCTAIRRTLVPAMMVDDVIAAVAKRLEGTTLGDPASDGGRWGPLASRGQVEEVKRSLRALEGAAERVFGNPEKFSVTGADPAKGAFFPAMLLYCKRPPERSEPHDIEAFGPVNTVMPYGSVEEAVELARRGRGSLCGSVVTPGGPAGRRGGAGTAARAGGA